MNLIPHPLATLMPEASPEEYIGLRDSIKSVGLKQPLLLWEGQVLDGRHRLRACQEIGIEPTTRELTLEEVGDGSPEELLKFVAAMNLHRRHLTPSQRAMAAARIVSNKEGRPAKTPPIGGVSRDQAAAVFNIGTTQLDRARHLLANANPAMVAMVEKGLVSLNTALETYEDFSQLAKAQVEEPSRDPNEPDYQALAHEIKKLRERNAKLAKDKTSLSEKLNDVESHASSREKTLAKNLDETRGEIAKLEEQIKVRQTAPQHAESVPDAPTPAPTVKIVYRENPSLEKRVSEAEKKSAVLEKLLGEFKGRNDYLEQQLSSADREIANKSARLARVESPLTWLTQFSSGAIHEFARSLDAVALKLRQLPENPPLLLGQFIGLHDKVGQIIEFMRDRDAHSGVAGIENIDLFESTQEKPMKTIDCEFSNQSHKQEVRS
ncbi:ParB family transcriptional regulator, chromosome partitioning protein [Gammaproteobacteria bacterium]